MKRVLVFTTQMMKTGGIESHIREFCVQMTNQIEVDLVVLNSAMLPENEAFFTKVCRKVFLEKNGRSILRLLSVVRIALICRAGKYDAIYTNGQGNSIKLFMAILGGYKTWVHHHHTSGDAEDQATWTDAYKGILQQATTIIACSKKNALDMEKALKRRIDSIPCFSRKIGIKPQAHKNDQIVRFGYYGRLIPEKGIDLLCALSEEPEFNNIEFHVWGEGEAYPPTYFDKFTKLIFHGTFNGQEELAKVIGSIDAFLLLSTHPEGLPICLLEAMGVGLPWMATDRGGITDIACDPLSTRVIHSLDDLKQLKHAIKTFADDLLEGKVSREPQLQQYAAQFSSAALIKRWNDAFGILNHKLN